MSDKTLLPIEQKEVLFYNDTITAIRTADGTVFVPIRPICERLGIDWHSQRKRINRDSVLVDELKTVYVNTVEGDRNVSREMSCLPLEFLSGFLFGISAKRVSPELQDQVIRYQRECYRVLSEAFVEGRLTSEPTFAELLNQESDAVQAYKMLQALVKLARNQILIEARLDTQHQQLTDHETRIETLEAQLGDETRTISEEQASQISQAVKTIAMILTKSSGSNQYGSVYGEFYRKFGITSYKLLPANQFAQAMAFLNEWHQSLVGEVPF